MDNFKTLTLNRLLMKENSIVYKNNKRSLWRTTSKLWHSTELTMKENYILYKHFPHQRNACKNSIVTYILMFQTKFFLHVNKIVSFLIYLLHYLLNIYYFLLNYRYQWMYNIATWLSHECNLHQLHWMVQLFV